MLNWRVGPAASPSTITNSNNNDGNIFIEHLLCEQALFRMLYEYHLLSQKVQSGAGVGKLFL